MNYTKSILKPQAMKPATPMLTAGGLPTLPGYVFRLNQLLSETEPDMAAVAQVIRTDASLTAQVLRLANLYRLETEEPVSSVDQAVENVGAARLRTMVITSPLLDCAADVTRWSSIQSFWQHNFMTAVLSESLARYVDYNRPELAYVAGLLRDVGELSLIQRAYQAGTQWPEGPSNGRRARSKEAGRRLAIACKLTPDLVEVCGSGDDPARAWHDPLLVKIVIAASRFCEANGLVSGGAPQQLMAGCNKQALIAELCELFRFSPQRSAGLYDQLAARFRQCMGELEFNHAGLLKAASEGSSMCEAEVRLLATA